MTHSGYSDTCWENPNSSLLISLVHAQHLVRKTFHDGSLHLLHSPHLPCTAITKVEWKLCHVILGLCHLDTEIPKYACIYPCTRCPDTGSLRTWGDFRVLYSASILPKYKLVLFSLGKRAEHICPHHVPYLFLLTVHSLSYLGSKRWWLPRSPVHIDI